MCAYDKEHPDSDHLKHKVTIKVHLEKLGFIHIRKEALLYICKDVWQWIIEKLHGKSTS